LKLQEDPRDLAIEVLAELAEASAQARLHLFALAFAHFAEPLILQIGKKRQQHH
jgi:hypothetical protein